MREDEQRALGRVADDLAVHQRGIVRYDVGQDRVVDPLGRAGRVLHLALQPVAHPRDRVAVARVDHLGDRHLVHRQRSGLVRVDRGSRPERLDRGQVLDDRAVLCQVRGAHGQHDLQHRRHRLGDRRDRQRDSAREQDIRGLSALGAQREHDHHRDPGGAGDPERERVELPGERSLLALRRRQHSRDRPHLRVGAGRRHDHDAAPVCHGSVHERHVALVAGVQLAVLLLHGLLVGGRALSGQGRLVDLQRRRLEDAPVGGDGVAGREKHDVADDDLLGVDLGLGAVAADAGGCLDHRLEGVHRALRLALLAQADRGVQDGDREHERGGAPLLDRERHDRCADQDDLHVAAVLVEEPPPAGHRLLLGQRVGAVLGQQFRRLDIREAGRRLDAEAMGYVRAA